MKNSPTKNKKKINKTDTDFNYYKFVAQEIRDPLILKYEMLDLIKEAKQEIKNLRNNNKMRLSPKKREVSLKSIENKLLKYYDPDGSFDWVKCAKWIIKLLKSN